MGIAHWEGPEGHTFSPYEFLSIEGDHHQSILRNEVICLRKAGN